LPLTLLEQHVACHSRYLFRVHFAYREH